MQEQIQRAFSDIFQHPIDGKVAVDNLAQRNIIEGWINLDEKVSLRWFIRVLKENPNLATQLVWRPVDSPEQLKQDRTIFSQACRHSGNVSDCEATFNEARRTLGPGFGNVELTIPALAVRLNSLGLASPSRQEREQWQAEANERRIQRENEILRSDDPQFRQQQKEIAARRSQEDRQLQTQQESQRQLQVIARDSGNHPRLPKTYKTEDGIVHRLDAEFIQNCDVKTMRKLVRVFGSNQLDRRLNGLD